MCFEGDRSAMDQSFNLELKMHLTTDRSIALLDERTAFGIWFSSVIERL